MNGNGERNGNGKATGDIESPGLYAQIHHSALLAIASLGGAAARVFIALTTFADFHTGACFPSYRILREKAKLSRQAVADGLRRLEGAGWISRTSGKAGGAVNQYVLRGLHLSGERVSGNQTPHTDSQTPLTGNRVTPPSSEIRERTRIQTGTKPHEPQGEGSRFAASEGANAPSGASGPARQAYALELVGLWNSHRSRLKVQNAEDGAKLLLEAAAVGLDLKVVEDAFGAPGQFCSMRLGQVLDQLAPGHQFDERYKTIRRDRAEANRGRLIRLSGSA